jgi:hypothetical protein
VSLLHQQVIRRLDANFLRRVIEEHALVASKDHVLLELLCAFEIERFFAANGWKLSYPGLVAGGAFFRAARASSRIDVFFQHAPSQLTRGSHYREVQRNHDFTHIGGAIPDLVLRISTPSGARWLLVEVKGVERHVAKSARAAVNDLLAYRRAFDKALQGTPVYGLGIAWGAQLIPNVESEICLCTPDTIAAALPDLIA